MNHRSAEALPLLNPLASVYHGVANGASVDLEAPEFGYKFISKDVSAHTMVLKNSKSTTVCKPISKNLITHGMGLGAFRGVSEDQLILFHLDFGFVGILD